MESCSRGSTLNNYTENDNLGVNIIFQFLVLLLYRKSAQASGMLQRVTRSHCHLSSALFLYCSAAVYTKLMNTEKFTTSTFNYTILPARRCCELSIFLSPIVISMYMLHRRNIQSLDIFCDKERFRNSEVLFVKCTCCSSICILM